MFAGSDGSATGDLTGKKAFIGGYPLNTGADYPIYPDGVSPQSSSGNPVWTINDLQAGGTYSGQAYDVDDQAAGLGIKDQNNRDVKFSAGRYDTLKVPTADSRISEGVVYNGVTFVQDGPGYVMLNSNMQGGASGSAVFDAAGTIAGVYFGAWSIGGQELEFGLMQPLVVTPSMASADPQIYTMGAYDLIAGKVVPTGSYRSSLTAPTYLFPDVSEQAS